MTGAAGAKAASTTLGRLDDRGAARGPRRRMRRRPGDLEVVAGVVAEGRPDEALERARVGRGRADRAAAAAVARRGPTQTRRRLRRAWAARSGASAVPEVAGRDSARRTSGPSGRWQASHDAADEGPRADAPDDARVTRRSPASGRGARRARVRAAGLHDAPRVARGRPLSSAVAGQIGLKLYHCSGRRADRDREGVGDRLGRALQLGRVGRRHLDRAPPTTRLKRVVGLAPDR